LLCATAWFAVWLTAFRPAPAARVTALAHPSAALRPALASLPDALSRPTLFALPSEQGFSGTFPEARIDQSLKLTHPGQSDFYLPRETAARPAPSQIQFVEPVSLPQAGQLSTPGIARSPATARPSDAGTFLFLSPNLRLRSDSPFLLGSVGPLPDFLRARLRVEPDGTVSQCFFETPLKNSALDGVIRGLHFHPVPESTDGWLEIRVNPGGGT
jgi:hypothetical protein